MLDPRSPSRWSCITPRYEGPFDFRKVTRQVEAVGHPRLPVTRVNELSIDHVGSEF